MILLIVLTVFSVTCRTTEYEDISGEITETLERAVPPVPSPPAMLPVHFEEQDNGLWLSYDDYRNLEKNIISYRSHIDKLMIVIDFYTEKETEKS